MRTEIHGWSSTFCAVKRFFGSTMSKREIRSFADVDTQSQYGDGKSKMPDLIDANNAALFSS